MAKAKTKTKTKTKARAKAELHESARPTVRRSAGDELGAAEMARRVAEVLKRLRAERRLSLDDLARRSGVSRAALSQIEGARTNLRLAVLWKNRRRPSTSHFTTCSVRTKISRFVS